MAIKKQTSYQRKVKVSAIEVDPIDLVVTDLAQAGEILVEGEAIPLPSTDGLPEAVDLFLEGRGERLRGEFSALPHMTLVIGNRALRGVQFKGKWYIESMARRGFMFSKVHNIVWRHRTLPSELGVTFTIGNQTFVCPFGGGGVVGASGSGKTALFRAIAKAHAAKGLKPLVVHVGEPGPEADTDMAVILEAIAAAIVTPRVEAVLLFDSFKGPLFTTPGAAGAGGFTRPFFQDFSDLSSIMARYEIVGLAAVNFLTKRDEVAAEVTESLIGNTVGLFEVISSNNGHDLAYRHYNRNYITGERSIDSFGIDKESYTVSDGVGPSTSVSEEQVARAIETAITVAPSLDNVAANISGRRITKSLFKRGN